MTLTAQLSTEDKMDIAEYTAQKLYALMNDNQNGVKYTDRQLSTKEAMEATGYKSHEHFRGFIKRNAIQPVRVSSNVKYYNESDLLKEGNR